MKSPQLSLFLENRPGQLRSPCRLLADAGINIVTLSLADTDKYGILRLIVRDWQKAKDVLEKAGCVVKMTEVVAIEVTDRPGGLADILDVMDEAKVNVEYMYAFAFGRGDRAVLVFRLDKPDESIRVLQAKGISFVGQVELFEQLEA